MNWLEKVTDPGVLRELSLGDKVVSSIYMALLGMAATFIALGIVWGLVSLFPFLAGRKKAAPEPLRTSPPLPLPPSPGTEELAAVIAAALAALGAGSARSFRVKAVRPTRETASAWERAGRWENLLDQPLA